jgi:hypothetical protein
VQPSLLLVRSPEGYRGEARWPSEGGPARELVVEHPPGTVIAHGDGPGPLAFTLPAPASGTIVTRVVLAGGRTAERRTEL